MAQIKLTVSDEQYAFIKQQAEQCGQKLSTFCKEKIMRSMSSEELETFKIADESKTARTITLSEEDAKIVKEKASKFGITPTQYIKRMARTKDFVIYTIGTDDLENYIAEVHSLITSVNLTVGLMKRQGQGKINQNDVNALKKTVDEITNILRRQLMSSYSNRVKVYNHMVAEAEQIKH